MLPIDKQTKKIYNKNMTISQKNYYSDHVHYACNRLGITPDEYREFRRIGNKLNSIYTKNCNGDYNDLTEYEVELLEKPYYLKADKLAKSLKLHIFYQSDPRGATIYLDKNKIPENDYTRASCIY